MFKHAATCIIVCNFLHSSQIAHAADYYDQQDIRYVRCMAARNVDETNITRQDVDICLREAGIADPGDEARQRASDAWRKCLATQTATIDDGISPAPDIARVAISICSEEWREHVNSRWIHQASKRSLISNMQRYATPEGVQMVLLVRKVASDLKKK